MDFLPQIPFPAKRWLLDEGKKLQFRIRTNKIQGSGRMQFSELQKKWPF